ncbi:MAG: TadE family protein [Lachnospiraceae bacterium]|nr:TadE family protein [Lachnospiraceae bacterium]
MSKKVEEAFKKWYKRVRCTGSATVEASLVLPLFLFAICTFMMIAQMIMLEASVTHSVDQTARAVAANKAVSQMFLSGGDGEKASKAGSLKKGSLSLPGSVRADVLFHTLFQSKEIARQCVVGGEKAILVTERDTSDSVKITATYLVRPPFPGFRWNISKRKVSRQRRIFSGYSEEDGSSDDEDDSEEKVYMTPTGSVYHTDPNCRSITIQKKSAADIAAIKRSHQYQPCKKCIKKGTSLTTVYISRGGSHYHSSMNCSAFKRTVIPVKKSQVKGKRLCKYCAGKAK